MIEINGKLLAIALSLAIVGIFSMVIHFFLWMADDSGDNSNSEWKWMFIFFLLLTVGQLLALK